MNRVVILVLEDEPEVRAAVLGDLRPFEGRFRIEAAADAEEAEEVVAECIDDGDDLGLVLCDHLLPGMRGTDFLVRLNHRPETEAARKVLLTGQAGHDDTIRAVNEADLDHYLAKPWDPAELQAVVRAQLTDFVVERGGELLEYVSVLEGDRLLEAIRRRAWDR
jgi:two-component system chemotaxis response regulator CheY